MMLERDGFRYIIMHSSYKQDIVNGCIANGYTQSEAAWTSHFIDSLIGVAVEKSWQFMLIFMLISKHWESSGRCKRSITKELDYKLTNPLVLEEGEGWREREREIKIGERLFEWPPVLFMDNLKLAVIWFPKSWGARAVSRRTWFRTYEEFASGTVHLRRHPHHSWAEDCDPSPRLAKLERDNFLHLLELRLRHHCARGLTEGE